LHSVRDSASFRIMCLLTFVFGDLVSAAVSSGQVVGKAAKLRFTGRNELD
jgi:hypothetical protein